jgi:hypothetical protein
MSNSVLSKNLASLKKKDPALFDKIAPLKGSKFYATSESKSGLPTLIHIDQSGNKKQIDSIYDPVNEASRNLERLNIHESINFIVLGLGLGYHVSEIIKKCSTHSKIYIFEKDPELFALTIRDTDFSPIFEHPGVKLFVDIDLRELSDLMEPERINFTLNEYCLISQKALIERNIEYYGTLFQEIEIYFNESKINLKTQSIHSKLYYKNIFSNIDSLRNSPGISCLKDCLPDIPAIICSAGPSLDKNIQLLKSSRNGFFLIAVATALKPLLQNGIQPDVVISIDPDELTIRSFDFFNETGDTWLVYNAAVPNTIPKSFPNRKIAFDLDLHLAKWFKTRTEEKGSLGKVTSVAHSAFNFAKHLACSPIVLLGQDLSFHKQSLHCKYSFYYEDSINLVSRFRQLTYLNRLKYLNFGQNLTKCIDLFDCQVTSTLAMDSYRQIFLNCLDTSQAVINATEGGVPIEGMINLSLRETLHHYCGNSIKEKFDSLMTSMPLEECSLKTMRESTFSLIRNLENISERVNTIKSKYADTLSNDQKQSFVNEMETLYKSILEYEETALLLQDYDFAGFSNWYRSNSQILCKKELTVKGSLLDEEFERDLKLLNVLEESVEYLRINFERSLSPEV